ncbi:MAG: ATP-binding protein [Lentisphaeria bacterium]|nr:ATP-binding protein [Lentisphaeria bacterium]
MLTRHLGNQVRAAAGQYPVVAVTGPRQSGKTTLFRALFSDYSYANMEMPNIRQYALSDPVGFLSQYRGRVILDEVQRVPELFSYIMALVDEHQVMGEYVLSGSQNFHLQEGISQSLAGRCATMKLLPFSGSELAGRANSDIFNLAAGETALPAGGARPFEQIFKGGFPPLYDRRIVPTHWLAQYTQSYLERDVRTLINVGDLATFEKFLRLCAGRSGQILNMDSLAASTGVSPVTVKRWISLLVASYTIFLLQPHHRNFNKRLIKSPKLYFYDTGLLCYLLNIRSAEELEYHSLRGEIFETYVIAEVAKACYNAGIEPPLYYWRDSQGHEVDLLIEHGEQLLPIEIKSAQTLSASMFAGLNYWQKLAGPQEGMLIYGGDRACCWNGIAVRPWFAV